MENDIAVETTHLAEASQTVVFHRQKFVNTIRINF